jgi:hypothetical protein
MKKLFILSLFVIFVSINAQAVEYYDDGQEHDISTPVNDSISIWNELHHLPETFTTVNILSGGSVNHADIYDTSIFNVFTGSWVGSIGSHDESNFTIFDGSVEEIELYHDSHGAISGGTVSEIDVWNQSYISVSGGDIVGTPVTPSFYTPGITTYDNGTVEISGGFINEIQSLGNSTVEMSGGVVAKMSIYEDSTANITGGNLEEMSSFHNSQIVMTDVMMDPGSFGVSAYDYSHMSISGGNVRFVSNGNSTVEVRNAAVDFGIEDNGQVTVFDSQINYLPPELHMNSSLNLTNTDVMMNNDITLYDTSHLTASTGTGLGVVSLYNNSQFTLSGGYAYSIGVGDDSLVEISEGDVYELAGLGYGTIEITGGHVGTLRAIEECQVDITGGDVSSIFADSSSLIVINGFDFNYDYGYITDTFGILTGTLLSGEIINTNFERLGDAQILLVPEPATLLMFGLGTMAFLRRNRR